MAFTLPLAETAADDQTGLIETQKDRTLLHRVICEVHLILNVVKEEGIHHDIQSKGNSDVYYLSFFDLQEKISSRALSRLVETFRPCIRNIHILMPKEQLQQGITLRLEIYKGREDRKRSDLPVFQGQKWRNDVTRRILQSDKGSTGTAALPSSWKEDMEMISTLSERVTNMREFSEKIEKTLTFDQELPGLGAMYLLVCAGIEKVSYDFLEYLSAIEPAHLTDIEFHATGMLDRSMTLHLQSKRVTESLVAQRKAPALRKRKDDTGLRGGGGGDNKKTKR